MGQKDEATRIAKAPDFHWLVWGDVGVSLVPLVFGKRLSDLVRKTAAGKQVGYEVQSYY